MLNLNNLGWAEAIDATDRGRFLKYNFIVAMYHRVNNRKFDLLPRRHIFLVLSRYCGACKVVPVSHATKPPLLLRPQFMW